MVSQISPYVTETFTAHERAILAQFFTNLDGPVFALVNLPEVVKGALFARYSRTHKSLRRLFLDEFAKDLTIDSSLSGADMIATLERAEDLYARVFSEFGDDSVAQLGGVHLACEQASNLLTKILEWGRLMAYLEQSTRYIDYSRLLGDHFRYFRPPQILTSNLGQHYTSEMDVAFQTYADLLPIMEAYYRRKYPQQLAESDGVYRQSIRAQSFDAIRGLLPAATLSNVGIYGTGQAYEALLLRMMAHPLAEAQVYADMMLTELRKVIPSFMTRVDRPDRGGVWVDYFATNHNNMRQVADRLLENLQPEANDEIVEVKLLDFDPDAEDKLVAAALWSYSDLSEEVILRQVKLMSTDDKLAVLLSYQGDRSHNRRHRPGRALERPHYRFEVLSDYGAFRDLQRHRMLTIMWQSLTSNHGFVIPTDIIEAGAADIYETQFDRLRVLEQVLGSDAGSYAVPLGSRIRYIMDMNAREAMHLLELRTGKGAHPDYARVCRQMHYLIFKQAGHQGIAAMMTYVDANAAGSLVRLESERRAEKRRQEIGDL